MAKCPAITATRRQARSLVVGIAAAAERAEAANEFSDATRQVIFVFV